MPVSVLDDVVSIVPVVSGHMFDGMNRQVSVSAGVSGSPYYETAGAGSWKYAAALTFLHNWDVDVTRWAGLWSSSHGL